MSREFNQLKRSFEEFYPRYKSWVEENLAIFPPDKVWTGAFTPQEVSVLLLEFAETIKIVLEDKEQCLKYVSESELQSIDVDLNNMLQVAKQKDYNRFAEIMETFIPRMRPFQFLVMEKMDEKRAHEISEIDKNLSEIKRLQKSVTSTVNKAKSDSEDLRNLIESTTKRNIKLDELINENNQKTQSLEELHNNAIDRAGWIDQYVDKIENILNGANEQKSKIDSFVNLIQEREEKITSQNVATEEYEKKLEIFSVEHQEKLKDLSEKYQSSMEKAEDLIQKSHDALNLSTASGLSKAFYTRQQKLEDKKVKIAWLVMGGLAVVGAIYIGVEFFDQEQNINIESVIGRTLLMTISIGVAVFCSKQYAKNRSLEEDYAYKVALAASLPGIAEECEKAESRKEYVGKLLDEILQDPQRVRQDKESLVDGHPLMAELKKFLKKNGTKTGESQQD